MGEGIGWAVEGFGGVPNAKSAMDAVVSSTCGRAAAGVFPFSSLSYLRSTADAKRLERFMTSSIHGLVMQVRELRKIRDSNVWSDWGCPCGTRDC